MYPLDTLTVTTFFKLKLQIPETSCPVVQQAYHFGKGSYRPISFRLTDPNQGAVIYGHVKNLKGLKNDNQKSFFIDEQLTEAGLERKRRHRQIKRENRAMPVSHQKDLTFNKCNLVIDRERYFKMIDPLTAKQVLLAPTEMHNQLRESTVHKGPTKQQGSSLFKSYMAEVHCFNDVKRAYLKVKEANMGATSIPCGYRMHGKDFPFKQDYSDDAEHGIGRAILEQLQSAGVYGVTVFIARHFDGEHIGSLQFDIAKDLTAQVIASYPAPLDYGHNYHDQVLINAYKAAAKSNPQAVTTEQMRLLPYQTTTLKCGRGGLLTR